MQRASMSFMVGMSRVSLNPCCCAEAISSGAMRSVSISGNLIKGTARIVRKEPSPGVEYLKMDDFLQPFHSDPRYLELLWRMVPAVR
jgi:hypothetical protein